MGCGCKKTQQAQQAQQPTATITITENQPAPPANIPLSEEQQRLVNVIVERINEANNES